jgi:hypothetical protein
MTNRAERRASNSWAWETGILPPLSNSKIAAFMASTGKSEKEIIAMCDDMRANDIVRMNAIYQVNIRVRPDMIHLSIKRRDRKPVGSERFRDFQRIKNELVGPNHEAVELYPAEDRLVDTANQYHLWVLATPNERFPFGYADRLLMDSSHHAGTGAEQRPFKVQS